MDTRCVPIIVLLITLAMGCATHPAMRNLNAIQDLSSSSTDENTLPQLRLDAFPRVGFAPLRVTIKAMLQNVPASDPVFGCLWQSWAFGDGAVSSEKSGCQGSNTVESEYFVEHVYRDEGVYQVRFIIGDNHVLSNPVQIHVVGRMQ